MSINWYPGHMRKTQSQIKSDLSLVDLVIEIVDARIPYSSKNPDLDKLVNNKARLLLLNKSDLASQEGLKIWEEFYKENNIDYLKIDSRKQSDIRKVIDYIDRLRDKLDLNRKNIRAMVVGIPNVGKSTFINTLAGRKGARVGNVPGITRGKQWVKSSHNIDLLDTPGILWPKFEDERVGEKLALTGAIKDNLLDIETLAYRLVSIFIDLGLDDIYERYGIEKSEDPLEVMDKIGRKRGCIVRGGEIDYSRVSNIIITEYRKGILGNHTLELPSEFF